MACRFFCKPNIRCFKINMAIVILLVALIFVSNYDFLHHEWKTRQTGKRKITDTITPCIRNITVRGSPLKRGNYIKRLHFDPNENKVIVFLHIQKTGGSTFDWRLVRTLNVTPKCKCKLKAKSCRCLNNKGNVWLYSGRFSTGWVCGVHADWTELTECIDVYFDKRDKLHRNRSYLYMTMLREPIQRYMSEWKHVQRGATWEKQPKCNHRKVTAKQLPMCFNTSWRHVPLDDFINCPHNLAINRQTRMLANLSLVDCYNTSTISKPERERIMLESAKNNLKDMAYFGLTEFQEQNQRLFEFKFAVNFTDYFSQKETSNAQMATNKISPAQFERIKQLNHLDIELYKYAKKLYFERIENIT
ncbi:unnamed protein product [Owenia fusiformis]|uniref:Heparan-sulfate 6-O-sulfotransferase n=1 Tax=Owenia fusiformis TaxID=6347 RepID=A0A8J1XTH2_OWEFU|nr:unnamed protein product [Owenia fusiformis]